MSQPSKMKIVIFLILAFHSCFIMAAITYRLERNSVPTKEESTAYSAIDNAMKKAVTRYNKHVNVDIAVTVKYVPSVGTADGNRNTHSIRFGRDPKNWTERVALHEISHILGVGWTVFDEKCKNNSWNMAKNLLRQFTKDKNAEIHCGGRHFWPFGLNFEKEFSEKNANRHCQMIQAMIIDGMR
ncbi:secreted protein [Melampsora americana]|nr:secreted protein [Melampsora americana]